MFILVTLRVKYQCKQSIITNSDKVQSVKIVLQTKINKGYNKRLHNF